MITWVKHQLYRLLVALGWHTNRTVRKAFPILLFSIALLGAATISSQSGSYVELTTKVTSVQAGDSFPVEVYVYADQPINAIDLAISYPADQVTVTGIDAGESVITLWTKEPYFKNNTVYLTGGTYRRGFTGRHLVARIDAVAKKSGTADISAKNIKLLAGDGTGNEVAVADTGKKSEVRINILNTDGEVAGDIAIIKVLTDIDGDGEVSMSDILRFMEAWRSHTTIYDFSGDGRMTFRDFAIILSDSFFK